MVNNKIKFLDRDLSILLNPINTWKDETDKSMSIDDSLIRNKSNNYTCWPKRKYRRKTINLKDDDEGELELFYNDSEINDSLKEILIVIWFAHESVAIEKHPQSTSLI